MLPMDTTNCRFKIREILRWSVRRDYDFTFLADTDSYIVPKLLMEYDFQDYDYTGVIRYTLGQTFRYPSHNRAGKFFECNQAHPWASGGIGYYLSRKAAEIMAANEPKHWAEDFETGQVLGPLYNEGKIKIKDAKNFEGIVSTHFPQARFKSQYHPRLRWMEDMHKAHKC